MRHFEYSLLVVLVSLVVSYASKGTLKNQPGVTVQCLLFCDYDAEIDDKGFTITASGEKCLCVHNIDSSEIRKIDKQLKEYEELERRMSTPRSRKKRSVDNDSPIISKLISDDKLTPQAFSDQCSSDEYWNGSSCIPLISLCPGGYRWNGDTCIIQSSIQTAAFVPSPPDTECPLRAKLRSTSDLNVQLASTVMPTYSTSPMCPFGFVWTENKCTKNPPLCPKGYTYRGNICHLIGSQAEIHESTTLPTFADYLVKNVNIENKWQQKPIATDIDLQLTHEIENFSNDRNENKITTNDQTPHCCMIMSPRLCRRIKDNHNEQWQCYHQRSRRCTEFCTKPNIYLRPKKFSFVEPILIMPPPPRRLQKFMQSNTYREKNIDCSGCLNGSYSCSSECFAYNCNSSDCEFIDEDLLCGNISSDADDDNSAENNDDYEADTDNDICAFSTS